MINENSILQDRMSNIKKRQTIAELLGISNRFKHLKMNKDDNSKYISQLLFTFNISEQNVDLDIMISELANYRRLAHQNKENNKGKIIESSSMNSLYHFLEKNLLEISYISDREKRHDRIRKLYEWFKNKLKMDEDIRTITMKTYKEKDEIDEQEALLNKSKNEKKVIIDDSQHRNLELINKKMLNEYERKRLKGPSWSLRKLTASQSVLSSILGKDSMIKTLSMFSANDFQPSDFSTLYSSVNGTNSFTNKNFDIDIPSFIDKPQGGLSEKDYISPIFQEQNSFLPPINRETKYSYSYLRPTYNFNDVYMENKIMESKQKSLALKRAQEEIKEKVREFGLNRARYKQNLNNKYELKNMINIYVNRNKLSSPLLRKYKIKNKNEDIDNKNNNNDNNDNNKINNIKINPKSKNSNSSMNDKNNEELTLNISQSSNINEIKKEKELHKEKLYNPAKKVSFSFSQKIKVFDIKDEKEKENIDSYKRNLKFTPKRTLSFRKKTKLKKRSNSQTSLIANSRLFSGINNKIITDNVQNIDIKSKSILDIEDIKAKNYKTSLNQNKVQSNIINKKNNNISKCPDTFTHVISNLPIIKQKIISENICQIKTRNQDLDTTESKSVQEVYGPNQNFYLSAFNKENISNFKKPKNVIKLRNNQFENLNQRYNLYKDNYLKMRRSMSNDKKREYEALLDKLRAKKINEFINEDYEDEFIETDNGINTSNNVNGKSVSLKKGNSLLEAIVNPNDNSVFSRYYLPRNGSMLLSRDELNKKLLK